MKKIFLLVATVLISTSAFAQFEWGVKAGLSLATVTDVTDVDAKMKSGFYAGAFAEYGISDLIGVQAELLFSMQGAKFDAFKFDTNGEDLYKGMEKNTMNYINLPILAKIYVIEGLSIDLGPQFGFKISDKVKYTDFDIDSMNETIDVYDEDGNKKFDVSFAMGLSYKIAHKFDISARYNLGLTKLADGSDSKNGVLQLGVGYRF